MGGACRNAPRPPSQHKHARFGARCCAQAQKPVADRIARRIEVEAGAGIVREVAGAGAEVDSDAGADADAGVVVQCRLRAQFSQRSSASHRARSVHDSPCQPKNRLVRMLSLSLCANQLCLSSAPFAHVALALQVGISVFANQAPAVTGIVKQRCVDAGLE